MAIAVDIFFANRFQFGLDFSLAVVHNYLCIWLQDEIDQLGRIDCFDCIEFINKFLVTRCILDFHRVKVDGDLMLNRGLVAKCQVQSRRHGACNFELEEVFRLSLFVTPFALHMAVEWIYLA